MAGLNQTSTIGQQSVLATNKVLRNTYMLLSMTLVFSAVTALVSMSLGLGHGAALIMMIAAMVIAMFVLPKKANSSAGIYLTFLITGLLGAAIGPMINGYLSMPGGPAIVFQALAGTAIICFSLSAYAIVSKKDFSFLGGFLMVGMIILLLSSVVLMFTSYSIMNVVFSAGAVLIFSLFMLYDTSRIIHGGETNYVMATVTLYINIFQIFIHLLHLLGVMNDD